MDPCAYKAIFEASPDSMWIFDVSTLQFLDVNSAATKIYGYSREEFLAMTVKDIRPASEIPILMASMNPDGESGNRVWLHKRKNGDQIQVTVFSTPTIFHGKAARAVTIRDVTDQNQSRQALAATNIALSAILSASPACILSVDPEGLIETYNPATERLLDIPLGEAKGKPAWELFGLREDVFNNTLQGVIGGKSSERMHVVLTRPNGDERNFLLSAAPLFSEDGTVRGAMAIMIDTTEGVRAHRDLEAWSELLERRVSERTMELEAANEELEAFCASVSHDLRSPLRAIDGFSRVILEDYGSSFDAEGLDYLNRIRSAAWRMSDLIDDLLGLTRLTRTNLSRSLVDLGRLAEPVAAEMRTKYSHTAVEFKNVESAVVYGDARLLEILLRALLDNAWKFTGKVAGPKVSLSVEREDDETIYCLRDNGAGFDMTYVGKLFRPFERLHRSSEFPGNGIGLATAHRIVSKHGGRIWAEGAPDGGATIRFTLDSMGATDDHLI